MRVSGQNATQDGLRDPRANYPTNFTLPVQDFPGLQRNFEDVVPDCGEESYVGSGRLQGRRALITGGDSGIGRAVAIAYAREGADVVINYLPEEQPDADDVIEVIESTTESRIFAVPGDLRNESFCEDLVAEAADLMGGLDILVNNAGYNRNSASFVNQTVEELHQMVETNIYAPFLITRAAMAFLQPGSSIIFTSSIIFETPPPISAVYAGTKAFLYTFARAIGTGLIPAAGIKVNVVRPPGTLTNFLSSQGSTPEEANVNSAAQPLGRMQHPVELAPQYVAFAANDGSWALPALV